MSNNAPGSPNPEQNSADAPADTSAPGRPDLLSLGADNDSTATIPAVKGENPFATRHGADSPTSAPLPLSEDSAFATPESPTTPADALAAASSEFSSLFHHNEDPIADAATEVADPLAAAAADFATSLRSGRSGFDAPAPSSASEHPGFNAPAEVSTPEQPNFDTLAEASAFAAASDPTYLEQPASIEPNPAGNDGSAGNFQSFAGTSTEPASTGFAQVFDGPDPEAPSEAASHAAYDEPADVAYQEPADTASHAAYDEPVDVAYREPVDSASHTAYDEPAFTITSTPIVAGPANQQYEQPIRTEVQPTPGTELTLGTPSFTDSPADEVEPASFYGDTATELPAEAADVSADTSVDEVTTAAATHATEPATPTPEPVSEAAAAPTPTPTSTATEQFIEDPIEEPAAAPRRKRTWPVATLAVVALVGGLALAGVVGATLMGKSDFNTEDSTPLTAVATQAAGAGSATTSAAASTSAKAATALAGDVNSTATVNGTQVRICGEGTGTYTKSATIPSIACSVAEAARAKYNEVAASKPSAITITSPVSGKDFSLECSTISGGMVECKDPNSTIDVFLG